MKDLSIEQKAKRYDEAVKLAKDSYNYPSYPGFIRADVVFPELKESEDEKIKCAAIEFVRQNNSFNYCLGISKEEVLDWLKKQGEKDEEILILKDQIESLHAAIKAIKETHRIELEKQGECHISHDDKIMIKQLTEYFITGHGLQNVNETVVAWLNDVKEKLERQGRLMKALQMSNARIGELIEKNYYLKEQFEKQEWQKTIDKVEPKFHKGEWITIDKPCQIISINDKGNYIVQYCDDENTHELSKKFCESYFHLWTIKDAKDGDVLANDHHILILKELGYTWASNGKPECLYAYCGIKPNGNFELEKEHYCFCGILHTHPATKEQRDKLKKAMADAGWEFDFEKKELKKIVVPKFNVHDCVIKKHNSNINDFGSFVITDISGGKYWYNGRIICDITEQDEWEIYEPVRQKPAEWSEENEQNLNEVLSYIKDDALKEFIKSLTPQKQWKPSDEQLKALKEAVDEHFDIDDGSLWHLYEDLKKLREE